MAKFRKITPGFVVQTFDENGNCITQRFVTDSESVWENEECEPILCPNDTWYFPFDMGPTYGVES